MKITKTNQDELNAVILIQITKEDYEPKVDTVLNDYRKKANIKGFRPGKIPVGIIKKMYGKAILVEEVNKLLSESLFKYIADEKLELLGEPIPSEKEQKPIDFENQSEFEFAFEIGLRPEINLELNENITLPYFKIKVDDKMIDEQVNLYTRRYGLLKDLEIVEENSYLVGNFEQIDTEARIIEEGLKKNDARIMLSSISDEEIKQKFLNANKNQIITFDVKKAFTSETDLIYLLGIKKEELETLSPDFQYTITKIERFEPAEINQELFNKIYGEGVITSEEEFKNKITEDLEHQLEHNSDYKFLIDTKENLPGGLNLQMPSGFLKRWLRFSDKEGKITEEVLEKEYPMFESDMKWQLVKSKISKDHDIKVTEEDLALEAKEELIHQFTNYGIPSNQIPMDYIDQLASDKLKKDEDRNRLATKKAEDIIIQLIKEKVQLDKKEITIEEFNKLFEPKS
jgi:trigger factor